MPLSPQPQEATKQQNKRLGQVFLKDRNVLQKMLDLASITPEDVVVEIGCGQGWLSLNLAQRCKKLYIIELDRFYLAQTQARLEAFSHVTYISGDALEVGFHDISESQFKIVANLPYQISAKFTKLIIENRHRIEAVYMMVQDEFAKKLDAKPGSDLYTSLTLYTQFYLETSYLFKVSRTCFRPIPRVDSAVISLIPKSAFPFQVEESFFFSLIQTAFWGRRKTLISCLAKGPYLTLNPAFKDLPFFQNNPTLRGETLTLAGFYEVYQALKGLPHEA